MIVVYMTRIYTKTGDKGETSLFSGERVPKYNPIVECYGTVDELNSSIGVALNYLTSDSRLILPLTRIQNVLFHLGSDLSTPLNPTSDLKENRIARINDPLIIDLEKWIDDFTESLPPLTDFILPGGSKAAAYLHLSRTICRRAERLLSSVITNFKEQINEKTLIYLNRLSDFLFVAARIANLEQGISDSIWEKA